MYVALFVAYFAISLVAYRALEGWSAAQATIFTLSIVTGVGYGHIVPSGDSTLIFTSVWIILGLVVFATIAAQVLDVIMQVEIEAASYLASKVSGIEEAQDYEEKRIAAKRTQFLAGVVNISVLYICSCVLFIGYYEESFSKGLYFASLSVLKLDSVCILPEVHCGEGSTNQDLAIATVWYILTFSTVAHFLISASRYLGHDPEPIMTTVTHMTQERFSRMDVDGDGIVRRAEFLRDRLIKGGICSQEEVDRILANFDQLDKDKNGYIDQKDVASAM